MDHPQRCAEADAPTRQDRSTPDTPRGLMDRWRAARRQTRGVARSAYCAQGCEAAACPRLSALEHCMTRLAAGIAAAEPEVADPKQAARLELWRMLAEAEGDEALCGPEMSLALSVGADLARRSGA